MSKSRISVDDDPITHFIIRKICQKLGVQASCYNEASKLLEELASVKMEIPDWILLDLNMPNVNGWQFLQALCSLKLDIAICILSSSIDVADIKRAQEHPLVAGYISKPLSELKLSTLFDAPNEKSRFLILID